VTASHGPYDLGKRHDIGEILKFVVAVWAANEYSRQLGRRISLAKRNRADDGKRTGGRAPYGMENAGCGGLKHGDPKDVKVIRWLFDQFGNGRSLCSLAGELNQQKVPGLSGGPWWVASIAGTLRRKLYRGDFEYNRVPQGQFFRIDSNGEVID